MPAKAKASKPNNSTAAKGSGVGYTRDELNNLLLVYYMIRDAVAGEPAVKGLINYGYGMATKNGDPATGQLITDVVLNRARRYLPQPNAADQSAENLERYRAYVTRAVFYGVTGRTLDGMVGQIFLRVPKVTLPDMLKPMLKNVDGAGLNGVQLSKRCVRHVMSYGRAGVLVDYPPTEGTTTRKQALDGDIQPTITVYNPWDVINWRTAQRGAKRLLTLVVLRETYLGEGDDNGFDLSPFEQYRVLRLSDAETTLESASGKVTIPAGTYYVELHTSLERQSGAKNADFQVRDIYIPTDSQGKYFNEIPFKFAGSENNDESCDKPPLYDLASLNIAHYRNSADYEESAFICGQPTPVVSGLDESWATTVMKGTVTLGSRAAVLLPVGGKLDLVQADPNNLPSEAMKHKEEQMVALGAKLVEQKASISSRRTATELIVETAAETCVLATVANNVSEVFQWAFEIAARFVGEATDTIAFQLNTEFELVKMSAQDQESVIRMWQNGAICFDEMRNVLKTAGVATMEDGEAKAAIDKEQADMMAKGPQVPMPNEPNMPNQPKTPDAAAAAGAGA